MVKLPNKYSSLIKRLVHNLIKVDPDIRLTLTEAMAILKIDNSQIIDDNEEDARIVKQTYEYEKM